MANPISSLVRLALVALLAPLVGACSVNYVDTDGNRRIIGLVNLELDVAEEDSLAAGERIELSNFGVMVFSSPSHGGVSLGYSREEIMMLRNDVLVVIDDDAKPAQPEGAE